MIALGVPPTFAIRSFVLQYSRDWEGNGQSLSRCLYCVRASLMWIAFQGLVKAITSDRR